jgi:hypothetical protein
MIFIRFSKWFLTKVKNRSKTPWARFETNGIHNGQVRYDMAWNHAFIKNLRQSGFKGHNEQELVEDFFMGSMILPKEIGLNSEFAQPDTPTPELTSQNNRFRR